MNSEIEDLRLYRYVFSATRDFVSVIDREYRYLLVNDTYLDLYRARRDEIIGRRVDELFDAHVFEVKLKKRIDRSLEGEVATYRSWLDLPTMGRRCLDITYSPYRDGQGTIIGVLAHGRDVTDLALALEEKQESQRRLEMMSRAGKVGLWDWNLETDEVFYSAEWKRQLGYADDEIRNHYLEWETRVHPEDREAAVKRIQAYLDKPWSDYSNEFRMIHRDGSSRWIKSTASLLFEDGEERPVRMMGAHIDMTEQKKREEALRESEEISRKAQRAGRIGYWWYDPATGCSEWTDEVFRIFGLDPGSKAPTLEEHKKYLAPEEWQRLDSLLEKASETGTGYDADLRITTAAGENKYIHAICEPVMGNEGRVVELVGTVQDITERRKAVEAAEATRKQYEDLFESIRDPILVADIERTVADCNQALVDLFGYEKEELLGQKTRCLYEVEEQFQWMGEKIGNHSHDASFCTTIQYKKRSGESFPGETSIHYLKGYTGEAYGVIGVIRDISERLAAEKRIQKSEARFRSLIENLFDAVVVIDQSGVILFANQAACELFGRTVSELVGSAFGFPVAIDTAQDIDILHKSGKRKYGEIKISSTDWEGEQVFLASIRDTTESILARQEREHHRKRLEHIQKIEAIGTLAGGIAHDFNNILTPILGFAEILRGEVADNEDASECVAEVYQSALRARDLVGQILAFSRQNKGSYRPITVEPIVKEVLRLLRSALPSTIAIEQNIRSKGIIQGDETEIHQILMNLCTNAMHAMEDTGGVLSVTFDDISITAADRERHGGLTPGKYVHLRIGDTGCGMDGEVIKKIYEPYYTTKEKDKGTGLGLSVVHGIVHNHGGAITVASEVGRGTVFDIYLPRSTSTDTAVQASEAQALGGREHILVVDDEPAVLRLNTKVLEGLGYQVTTRSSSLEALALFENRSEDFDLLLSDMTMPEMTGDILAAECLAIRPDLPVIIATGFSERINTDRADSIGIRKVLKKPLTRVQLAEALREALGDVNPAKEEKND